MSDLKMHTANLVAKNIEKLTALFPNCITETRNEQGDIIKGVDFDLLRQELSEVLVEGEQERYTLNWVGKKESILAANAPIAKTLRPCREESVNFDATENLFIEGDNLDALKLLQENYLGKVKMIYIDPPYNTGTAMIYKNNFAQSSKEFFIQSQQYDEDGNRLVTNIESNGRFHSDWLSMMYSRLKLTRHLLRDDGFVILAMDDSEIENLIKICDEVFGRENKIGLITVVHKPEGRNQEKFLGTSNEFALIYAKNKIKASFNDVILDKEKLTDYIYSDKLGKYKRKNFIRKADGKYATREAKPKFWYPIYVSQDLKHISLNKLDDYYEVYPIIENGVERTWKTLPETFNLLNKNKEIEADYESGKIVIYEKMREKQVIKTHWIKKEYHAYHFGTKVLDNLLESKTFDFPKSLYLMIDLLKITVKSNDLILDFFAGSGTTAHAVMQLNAEDNGNRKFICVQLPEKTDEKSEAFKAGYSTIAEISKERIRRAGLQILQNLDENKSLDVGFRVLKIDSSNMKDIYYQPEQYDKSMLDHMVSHIKEDRTAEDLLFQVMLDWGIELSLPIERKIIDGSEVYFVAGNTLVACFDKFTMNILDEIAKIKPLRVVSTELAIVHDQDKTNIKERFKQLSPDTEVRFL
ncbi:site-specific DNA-methyltransferase [uncultured Aggregatibacter sp.]|uniref:site-specific DNA-methyltransferase n=1 Tax=uncultured Aggregatibacter sp. TaxID=470564 RepID=UPI0025CC0185|nr:site-specific DNA-methyltransferase [uncultured Aggregatibacter sp.]